MPRPMGNWDLVGTANRREINATGRWFEHHAPGTAMHGVFHPAEEADRTATRHARRHGTDFQQTLERKRQQHLAATLGGLGGTDDGDGAKRVSFGGAKAGGSDVSELTPERLRQHDELQSQAGASETAGGAPTDGRRVHVHRKHKKNCPRHAQHVKAVADATDAPDPFAEHKAAAVKNREEATKVRRDGPGLERVTIGGRKVLVEKPPVPLLPAMAVPQTVGRGLAMFLTGVYAPQEYHYRPTEEYPHFPTCTRAASVGADPVDNTLRRRHERHKLKGTASVPPGASRPVVSERKPPRVKPPLEPEELTEVQAAKAEGERRVRRGETEAALLQRTSKATATATGAVGVGTSAKTRCVGGLPQPPLLHFPVDKRHCRLKDEIKSHHELAAAACGGVMTRGATLAKE